MSTLPPCDFYVVDEANQARFPYRGYFFPRAGDFIDIGGICLKVLGVSLNSAKSDGAAVHGSVNVYVEKTSPSFGNAECDDQDVVEYCQRVRDRLP